MMKTAICGAILLLSYLAGYLYTAEYKSRVCHLEGLLERFLRIKTRMGYCLDPLPELFRLVGDEESSAARLFWVADREMSRNDGTAFSEIWKEAVEESFSGSTLRVEETECLLGMGKELGSTDLIQQQKTLEHICAQLEQLLERAREEKKKNTRLYRTLFTAGGFMIVIILM